MNLKKYFLLIYILLWGYALVVFFSSLSIEPEKIIEHALRYVKVLWICWVIKITMAIYIKWKKRSTVFFYIIYALYAINTLLLVGFFINAPDHVFLDKNQNWELKLFLTTVIIFILTGILQLAVNWFTKRPHRKMK
ncbi:hypothetical protein [Mesonia aquimarina]|uniref:hypothetical protein n=1 Tax=Mesonia aquimarina TaxID=1504967 RepID=UPI000EF61478|nr:hypothetical protein [Mesonia aquimarina]